MANPDETKYIRNPAVTETTLDDDVFLVEPGSGEVFYLNLITSGLWSLFAEAATTEEALAIYRSANSPCWCAPCTPRRRLWRSNPCPMRRHVTVRFFTGIPEPCCTRRRFRPRVGRQRCMSAPRRTVPRCYRFLNGSPSCFPAPRRSARPMSKQARSMPLSLPSLWCPGAAED